MKRLSSSPAGLLSAGGVRSFRRRRLCQLGKLRRDRAAGGGKSSAILAPSVPERLLLLLVVCSGRRIPMDVLPGDSTLTTTSSSSSCERGGGNYGSHGGLLAVARLFSGCEEEKGRPPDLGPLLPVALGPCCLFQFFCCVSFLPWSSLPRALSDLLRLL